MLLPLVSSVQAQLTTDTLAVDSTLAGDYLDAPVYTETAFDDGLQHFAPVDTSLHFIQRYNPARKAWFPRAYLSNQGAPATARWFSDTAQPGLRTGREQFDYFLYQPDSLKFYRTTAPFTDIYYLLGQYTEQLFHIRHTQNFGRDLNLAVDFQRMVSQGYYQQERHTFSNLALTGWWQTKSQRYKVYGAFLFHDIVNEESGGLRPDTLFTTFQSPTSLAEPWLENALTDWKHLHGRITQTYDFGIRREVVTDDDSTYTVFVPKVRLRNSTGAYNKRYLFADAGFDRSFYNDASLTADTLRAISDIDGWYNQFEMFSVPTFDSTAVNPFNWRVGARYEAAQLSDERGAIEQDHLILSAATRLALPVIVPLDLQARGQYDVLQQDVLLAAQLSYGDSLLRIGLDTRVSSLLPTLLQRTYSDFRVTWNNTYNDQRNIGAGIRLQSQQWRTELTLHRHQLNNYVFFAAANVDNQPKAEPQAQLNLALWQLQLSKHLQLGNFHFRQSIGWQSVTQPDSGPNALNLPTWLIDLSWYYEKQLFSNALGLQAGFDTWWVSDYTADAYDPVAGVFYVQNNEVLSFYPVTDVFINFDIRSFRFFVKADNITQGLFANGYFEAPDYPMQNRSVKLGMNWYVFY